MRHLWSLLAGVVAAPLAWLLLATGQHRSKATVASWDAANFFDTVDLIGPAVFLAVAGVMLGVLGTLRWSPAGPLAAGLLLVLPTLLMFINPFDTLDWFSFPETRRVFGQDFQPWLPVENGTLLVLGALLLMAVFSMQRWRNWPTQPAPEPAATDQDVVAGVAALTGDSGSTAPMSDDEILAAAAALDEQSGSAPDSGTGTPPDSGTGTGTAPDSDTTTPPGTGTAPDSDTTTPPGTGTAPDSDTTTPPDSDTVEPDSDRRPDSPGSRPGQESSGRQENEA